MCVGLTLTWKKLDFNEQGFIPSDNIYPPLLIGPDSKFSFIPLFSFTFTLQILSLVEIPNLVLSWRSLEPRNPFQRENKKNPALSTPHCTWNFSRDFKMAEKSSNAVGTTMALEIDEGEVFDEAMEGEQQNVPIDLFEDTARTCNSFMS